MARPFANKMTEVMGELAKRTDQDFHHPLLDLRGDQRYLLVLITADKGLCGGLSIQTHRRRRRRSCARTRTRTIEIMAIGRKGRDFFRNRHANDYERVSRIDRGRVEFSEALSGPDHHQAIHRRQEIDKVFLIYNEFKSVLSQRVVLEQLLPISHATAEETETKQAATLVDYIYEQPPEEMFSTLLPRLVETQIFRALLESLRPNRARA